MMEKVGVPLRWNVIKVGEVRGSGLERHGVGSATGLLGIVTEGTSLSCLLTGFNLKVFDGRRIK